MKMRERQTHQFTLLLQGADVLKEENLEALRRAGSDDALFGRRDEVFYADFAREGASFEEAVLKAIREVERAVPGLQVVRVEPEEFVSAAAIADRTGRTRESVRLLIEAKRGPGGFPSPIAWTSRTRKLWRWADVAHWFQTQLAQSVPDARDAAYVMALNAALAFRQSVLLLGVSPEIKIEHLSVRPSPTEMAQMTAQPTLIVKETSGMYESKSLLFDEGARTDQSYKHHRETNWEFLNRAQRVEFENVRNLLEEWFQRLPPDAKRLLEGGLKSASQEQFRSAFFELYLHETFIRLGFDVEVHPTVSGRATRPDFLIRGPHGIFYVEAKAFGPAQSTRAQESREEAIYEALDDTNSPNFFLMVDQHSAGPSSPNVTPLKSKLERWLSLLDPDSVQAELDRTKSLDRLPAFPWEEAGWSFTFRAMPKAKARGRAGVRTLGNRPFRFSWPNAVERLRQALKDKQTRYGRLTHPYVIALSLNWDMDSEDVADALYGTSVAVVDPLRRVTEHRKNDGIWSSGAPIAGLIVARDLWPWSIASQAPTLWHRPDQTIEFSKEAPWRQGHLEPDGVHCHVDSPKAEVAAFFGVWANWPHPRGQDLLDQGLAAEPYGGVSRRRSEKAEPKLS